MINFNNGLSISGNPKVVKTEFGVKITNDYGLSIELSNYIWNSFN